MANTATSDHRVKNVVAGCVGNVLEWYDFALYGFFAPVIAKLFFPSDNQITGLLAIADDKLDRTIVRSPRAGIIMNMQVTKKGEVVSAGSTLASLVPETTHLIISARLNPADSASITAGLNARITIMAFNSRTAPTLEGVVTYVSPDVVTDENTGLPYYPVHVELTDAALALLGNDTLQPGMPAQVVITTAERPIIGYLLDPIMQTVRNAFHEK